MFRLLRLHSRVSHHSKVVARGPITSSYPAASLSIFGGRPDIDKFIQNYYHHHFSNMAGDGGLKEENPNSNETQASPIEPPKQEIDPVESTNTKATDKVADIHQKINSKSSKRKRNEEWVKGMRKASAEKKKNKRPGEWKSRNTERDEVHAGSYANAEMRMLFDISLPELDTKEDGSENDVTSQKDSEEASAGGDQEQRKHPKRKVALLLGFLGTKYGGMQINKGQKSLQAEIELALFKAGVISKSNFGFPKKYSWSNSARTDKGVHSCAQVCSAKLLVPNSDYDVVRELINAQLPDDITVADCVQVPRTFCARTQRDKVRYQYMLPSFALLSCDELRSTFESTLGSDWQKRPVKEPFTEEEAKALRERFRNYRASDDVMDHLTAALGAYVGTHKFHNYTNGKNFDDPSAKRFIHSFTVQEKIVDKHGIEWIPTLVVGQSFLLHQIRKMMSMAMDAARGASSIEIMDTSFSDKYLNINTAPAQGLFLDMSYYENFNKRKNQAAPKLDWHSDEKSPAHQRWKKFKEDQVMSHIMDEEEAQGNFINYLFAQDYHIRYENYVALDSKKGT